MKQVCRYFQSAECLQNSEQTDQQTHTSILWQMKRERVSFITRRAWVFGEWIMPSFQQMFYGVCCVSALDCQRALSFYIFHKCEYESQKLHCFHSMPSFEETSLGTDMSGGRWLRWISLRKQNTFKKTFTLDYIVHIRFGLNIAHRCECDCVYLSLRKLCDE